MTPMMKSDTNREAIPWWVLLAQGIAAIVAGLYLIGFPLIVPAFYILILGWYWLLAGSTFVILIFADPTGWGWKLFISILNISAGLCALIYPVGSILSVPIILIIILAILGLFISATYFVQAFRGGGLGPTALGTINIIFSIILLASPMIRVVALPWALSIWTIGGGIFAIIVAFRIL